MERSDSQLAATGPEQTPGPAPPKLLERLRQALQVRQVAPGWIAAYLPSIEAYSRFHGLRHPRGPGLTL